MIELLKLKVLLHWFIIYIVVWIAEEIIMRLVIHWWVSRNAASSEPTPITGTSTT